MHTHLFLFLFCLIDRNADLPLPHFFIWGWGRVLWWLGCHGDDAIHYTPIAAPSPVARNQPNNDEPNLNSCVRLTYD